MSGIAGCLALAGGTRPDADWVLRAVRRMAHRGPDDEHVISDGPVTLGARRLAVIDPSAAGRQPMRSADGRYVIVYNGEIYNYTELAQRLRARGVVLRGRSDTELLLETYAAEGREALRKLRGMFAFAIWDAQTGELFCARDPFGIKPFYYALAEGGRQFRFASERKALLGPGRGVGDRSRRAAPVPVVPVRPRAVDDDAAGDLPAAGLLAERAAGCPA